MKIRRSLHPLTALLALMCALSPAFAFSSPRRLGATVVDVAYSKSKTTYSAPHSIIAPGDNDPTGLKEGKYLLILVMLINIWAFSIPPEFRRAQFCSEEQVRDNPESNCITFDAWKDGIAEYYNNGGGVDFNFEVEGGNKWIGS